MPIRQRPFFDIDQASCITDGVERIEGRDPGLGVATFLLFLFGFAVNAELSHRSRLDALGPDVFATAITLAEHTLLNALERLVDLPKQPALSFAQATLKSEVHFRRRRIDFVGKVVGIQMDFAGQRFACIFEDLVPLFLEGLTNLIHVAFLQRITFQHRDYLTGRALYRLMVPSGKPFLKI